MRTLDDFLTDPTEDGMFLDGPLTPPENAQLKRERRLARWRAAERLREALSCVPFYAKRAEKARLAGDEMAYWLDLQGSEATLRRKPKASSTPDATT
jgi:hypothetical protein